MDKTVEQIAQETIAVHQVEQGLNEAAALVDEARVKLHDAERRIAQLTRFGARLELPPYAGLILDNVEDDMKALNSQAFDVGSRLARTGSRMERRALNAAFDAHLTDDGVKTLVEQLAAAGLDMS